MTACSQNTHECDVGWLHATVLHLRKEPKSIFSMPVHTKTLNNVLTVSEGLLRGLRNGVRTDSGQGDFLHFKTVIRGFVSEA